MPRFFVNAIEGEHALIHGEDARHITKSLRMRAGEHAVLCDGEGTDYHCEAVSFGETVVFRILRREVSIAEPSVRLRLFQALPKGDKLEWIVQKAVELGVSEIVPVLTKRCIARPEPDAMEKRRARLSRVALEAAKQSGRGRIPEIAPLIGFQEAVSMMCGADLGILCYEAGGSPLRNLVTGTEQSIDVLIGSEGGFEPEEAAFAVEHGIKTATLGTRILRCETAPLAALSVVMHLTGNL